VNAQRHDEATHATPALRETTDLDVLEYFRIPLPHSQVVLRGMIIRTDGEGGRRIVIRTARGVPLFDEDFPDLAAALARQDEWLTEIARLIRPAPQVEWQEASTVELPALTTQ
jgi:hypothetical protein